MNARLWPVIGRRERPRKGARLTGRGTTLRHVATGFSMIVDRRFRQHARLVLVCAAALEAALVLPFVFFYDSRPEIPTALAVLAAVAAAVAGGPWLGAAAAALGLALVAAFVADDPLAALAIPPGIAVAALVGIVADRLRRAETERQRVARGLDVVRETVSDAVVGVDLEGMIVGWSAGAARLYGYGSDVAVGRPFSMLLPDDSPVTATGEHVDYGDVVQRRADGSDIVVSLTFVPVADAAGEVIAAYAVAADVNERVQVQEKLRESESKYRALVEQLPLVTYLQEAEDGNSLLYVSPQVDSLLGYTAAEVLAEPKLFTDVLAQGHECRTTTRDGRVVWLRHEAVTVRDARGRPLYRQGYLLDISERKGYEIERESLRAAESAALARVDEGRLRLDALGEAGELVGSSLEYATTLKSVAELVVRHFADWCVFHVLDEKEELEPIVVAHAEPLGSRLAPDWRESPGAQRVVQTREPEVVPPLGSPPAEGQDDGKYVSYICAPLLVRRRVLGTLTLISTTPGHTYDAEDVRLAQDVAQRAAIAIDNSRLYREVEDRADAQRVLAHVADGVFLLDRAGVVRLWNPAAEAITGLVASAVVGRAVSDVLPEWDNLASRIRVSTVPDPARSETVPFETGRGERWLSISGVEFFGGTVYAFRDITEERRLDELKSEFVATASHELRTPLAAVYGAAQTLRRHDFALDEGGRERFISIIAEESERLGRIVNEILLANQLDSGRLDLVTEPFDAAELVARVVEASRAHLPPGISLRIRMPDSVPPVDADREKVRQVLVNLIENAVKYSPGGGRIEVGLNPRDAVIRFFVKDKGLGIPLEEQERIFDKFYRLDPDMARGVGGTGLGLYICSELVTRMGGRIWVESQEGEGSIFSFELPSEAGAPSRPAAAGARGAQNGPTPESSTPAAHS
jgi:two-component system phosphate regulon sensor histidine kinase PhoR